MNAGEPTTTITDDDVAVGMTVTLHWRGRGWSKGFVPATIVDVGRNDTTGRVNELLLRREDTGESLVARGAGFATSFGVSMSPGGSWLAVAPRPKSLPPSPHHVHLDDTVVEVRLAGYVRGAA